MNWPMPLIHFSRPSQVCQRSLWLLGAEKTNEGILEFEEMALQRMDAKRGCNSVVLLTTREHVDHVLAPLRPSVWPPKSAIDTRSRFP